MRYLNIAAYVALALLLVTRAARAGTLYEQLPGPLSHYEFESSKLDAFGHPPGYRTADDFVLAANGLISEVNWWGGQSAWVGQRPPVLYDFELTFYANDGGVPGAILHTSEGSLSMTTVNVGNPNFYPVILFSSELDSPFTAEAGVTYWISIFNQANVTWYWLDANDPGDGAAWGPDPGPPWSDQGYNMAFQLASVPEPSGLVLLGTGAVGLLSCGARRRARTRA